MSLNLITQRFDLQVVAEVKLGMFIGQLRAVPVNNRCIFSRRK